MTKKNKEFIIGTVIITIINGIYGGIITFFDIPKFIIDCISLFFSGFFLASIAITIIENREFNRKWKSLMKIKEKEVEK